jgi:hypothetical protein
MTVHGVTRGFVLGASLAIAAPVALGGQVGPDKIVKEAGSTYGCTTKLESTIESECFATLGRWAQRDCFKAGYGSSVTMIPGSDRFDIEGGASCSTMPGYLLYWECEAEYQCGE